MNKKKIAVLSLLMIVILVLTSCLLVACNPDNSEDSSDTKVEATKGLLINNSDFKVIDTTVTTYPRSATSWTGAKMYSSGSFRDDVTAGIINLEKAVYNANKSKWNDVDDEVYNKLIEGGNRFGDDDEIKNTLMIYMPEESKNADGNKIYGPTAYGYTSTSFTLDKGSYYKFTVDVLTYNIKGENESERGARIYLSSNTYAEFSGIDTHGEWKTYTMFVETAPAGTTSLTIMLGLGKYNSYYTSGLTSGYAFFDNVKLEKVETADDKSAEEQFSAAQLLEQTDKTVTTATLKVPNGRFDFGSTNLSSSGAPNTWALVTGNSGKSDPAPTSLGYNGIIDLSKFATDHTKYSQTYQMRAGEGATNTDYTPANDLIGVKNITEFPGARIGTNAFMLSQQLMTAQGIRSSRTITIEKNKIYALSIDLYTFGIHGAGVSLILTGSDGKDIVLKGISSQKSHDLFIGSARVDAETGYSRTEIGGASTDGWRTYTFYIKGNQFRDYNYNMAIWLGTDGTSNNEAAKYQSFTSSTSATTYYADGTFSNGWVFIDELTINDKLGSLPFEDDLIVKAENQTLDCTDRQNIQGVIVDLTTENLFGAGDEYILSDAKATNTTSTPQIEGVEAIDKGAPAGWLTNFDVKDESNPIIANTISEGIVNIANEDVFKGPENTYPGMPYDMVSTNAYMIHASAESYYEVETAPFSIAANQFYRIALWVKTVDVSSSSGAYVYLIDKDHDDASLTSFTKLRTVDYDSYLNDWCELTIVVRGATDKASNVALKFTLGTGDRWASSTLTSGSMFVANMNMSTITHANFNDTTTGTYVKSVDMSEAVTYTFKNGSFDDYDLDDENLEENKSLSEQSVAAKPDEWTINDNTVDINGKNDTPLFAGVIALNPTESKLDFATSMQAQEVTGIAGNTFNNFYANDGQYSKDYLDSLAGPNILAIGSKDASKKFAIGFESSSVTLSSNTYYMLSVYAKTVGVTTASIFLTGESSASTNVNSFTIENISDNSVWTKYTFLIEVGNTSVSVKLNLWLGQDTSYVDIDKEEAKSSGAVFFDNIVYKTIEEDEYNNATANEINKKISFLTDSFDSLSTTIESRSSLTTPNGWSGSALGNQSSSLTKSGVVYADKNFYETETVDKVEYSRLLGEEYKLDNIEITDKDIAEARKDPEYAEMDEDELITTLTNKKFVDQKKDNWIPVSELEAHSGHRMLVINNTQNSAYRYTSSSNTLKKNSFYEVSVFVRTYGLGGKEGDDTIGASIELYLGSADETNKPLIFEKINTQKTDENGTVTNEWTEYRFYIQTRDDDVTSVTVRLALGSHETKEVDGDTVVYGLTRGYAMFDDVTIQKVDETTYANAEEGDYIRKRPVSSETSGDSKGPEEGESNTPSNKFNLEYLWWMIPSIIIGLAIIIVVIVFIIRKLRKPVAKKAAKTESAPINTEMLDKKRNRYDEGKE